MKKKKIKRKKFKRNKKVKRGGGINPFVDGFKFLYSIGKQYRKSTRWKEKQIMQWWNLQLLKE